MSLNPINQYTESYVEATPAGHTPTDWTSYNNKIKIQYKPDSFFDSIKNFFNISALFSSIRAMLASLFAPSGEAKEIRDRLTLITKSNETIDKVNTAAGELLQSLRKKPADISLTEAHKIREDSVISLFNKGSFQAIVENYADWQTEGSPKEGEVWRIAYDQLRENVEESGVPLYELSGLVPETMMLRGLIQPVFRSGSQLAPFDYKGAAVLFSKAPTRYEEKIVLGQKLRICNLIIQKNFYKSVQTLKDSILATTDPEEKKRLEDIKNNLIKLYSARCGDALQSSEKMQTLWQDLKVSVEGSPAENLMKEGYIQFS